MPKNMMSLQNIQSKSAKVSGLPGASSQTLYLAFDGSGGNGTFSRSTNAWNPETGLIAANNLKVHSEFENGGADLSTLLNVSIGSLTGFTNAAVFAAGAVQKYFQWSYPVIASPVAGEVRVYSCYVQMADLSAPNPTTGLQAGTDMGISQGVESPTYGGKTLVDAVNSIYRVWWYRANTGGEATNIYLQQPANGSGKSFKVSGCMVERVSTASVTTPSPYIKTTSLAVYMPRYVTGKSGQGILIEESSTNSFLNSTVPVTQNISVTTANSGKWTCSVVGAGTVTSSAGTATATGYGAATAGSPRTITVTGNGTVTFTVAGADATTRVQVENLAYPTSHIVSGTSPAIRGAETLTHPTAGYLSQPATINLWRKLNTVNTGTTQTLWSTYTDASNYTSVQYIHGTGFTLTKRVGGVTTTVTSATAATVGTYYMITLFYNANNTMDLWVNLVQAGTNGTTTTGVPVIATTMQIGSLNGTLQVNGVPDQDRFWNRILTLSELTPYYSRGK